MAVISGLTWLRSCFHTLSVLTRSSGCTMLSMSRSMKRLNGCNFRVNLASFVFPHPVCPHQIKWLHDAFHEPSRRRGSKQAKLALLPAAAAAVSAGVAAAVGAGVGGSHPVAKIALLPASAAAAAAAAVAAAVGAGVGGSHPVAKLAPLPATAGGPPAAGTDGGAAAGVVAGAADGSAGVADGGAGAGAAATTGATAADDTGDRDAATAPIDKPPAPHAASSAVNIEEGLTPSEELPQGPSDLADFRAAFSHIRPDTTGM
ncbi:unnamed protein product [Closterium sp. NIES-53]